MQRESVVMEQSAGEESLTEKRVTERQSSDKEVLIEVNDLKKHFPIKKGAFKRTVGYVRAVDGVSFNIYKGETFGLVGESGSGKSTLGRVLLRLQKETAGRVNFDNQDLFSLNTKELRKIRKDMQIIFQDPFGSLDPRFTIEDIIAEPYVIHKTANVKQREQKVNELLELVGLDPSRRKFYPHEFSGGQRQRVGIARAVAMDPKFIVADEAVSALDVSVQAQVINLMKRLQDQLGLTYLFIAHGLNVIRHISDRVGVMYLGRMVEIAETEKLYNNPAHPYTEALIKTNPIPNPHDRKKREVLKGEIPSPANPPSGCPFHTRCPIATQRCKQEVPEFQEIKPERYVACHYPLIN